MENRAPFEGNSDATVAAGCCKMVYATWQGGGGEGQSRRLARTECARLLHIVVRLQSIVSKDGKANKF